MTEGNCTRALHKPQIYSSLCEHVHGISDKRCVSFDLCHTYRRSMEKTRRTKPCRASLFTRLAARQVPSQTRRVTRRVLAPLHVPKVKKNLFSVGVCTSKGFELVFKGQKVTIVRDDEIVASGIKQENEIYRVFSS